jgi:hypothetical protein
VRVTGSDDDFTGCQLALLAEHQHQGREAGGVEGQAEKTVAGADVQLRREPPPGHVELVQQVTGGQGHAPGAGIILGTHPLVGQVFHVPRVEQDAATVGTLAQAIDDVVDLVDLAAIARRPGPPLAAVDRTQVPGLRRPLVPDGHAVLLQPGHVRVAAQEPDQLVDDALQVNLLGREQGEAGGEITAKLAPEHGQGAGTGAIFLAHTVVENVLEEVEVGLHGNSREFSAQRAGRHTAACTHRARSSAGTGSGHASSSRRPGNRGVHRARGRIPR